MDLSSVTVPPEKAVAMFETYRAAVKSRHTAEDEAIFAGLKALQKGKRLISLRETMRRAGVDHRGLPRVAVIRADSEFCWTRPVSQDGSFTFRMERSQYGHATTRRVEFPAGTLSDIPTLEGGARWSDYKAIVPPVPPQFRPRGSLHRYHTLFEADWKTEPPVDPALLKHLRGDLWIVLAEWDLTPLERAVLGDSRR